jgi:putative glutamine amidotransferase
MELLHEFVEAGKPVLGICRGMQLINVAFGGSLYQDIPSQFVDAARHEADAYDRHSHPVHFAERGALPTGLVLLRVVRWCPSITSACAVWAGHGG